MQIEFEAKFKITNKLDIRQKLTSANAQLVRPEFIQKREVFNLPKGHEIPGSWLRVRDETDKTTLSLKIVAGKNIEDQKELCLTINDFETAVTLLQTIGCEKKAFQETKREVWQLDNCEIMIDEWPHLEPFIEIEGPSEVDVRSAAQKLGFNYKQAIFGAVDTLYAEKYNITKEQINNNTELIAFDAPNPFI